MKQNRQASPWIFYVMLLLLCLVLVTSSLVSGMLARYSTVAQSGASARVAYFTFAVTENDGNNHLGEIDCTKENYSTKGSYSLGFTVSNYTNENLPAETKMKYDIIVTMDRALVKDLELTLHANSNVYSPSYSTVDGHHVYTFSHEDFVLLPGGPNSQGFTLKLTATTQAVEKVELTGFTVKAVGTQVD